MNDIHIPVLLKEIKALLNLTSGERAIDGTLGGGGHTKLLLDLVGQRGKILGIESDPEMLKLIETKKGQEGGIWENLTALEGSYADIKEIARNAGFDGAGAVLLDLGISTWHLKSSGKGFTFTHPDEPLIMRFSSEGKSAAELVNQLSERELEKIFKEYGELRRAKNFAMRVCAFRKKKRILTVGDFLEAVSGGKEISEKTLAMIFQSVRIAVNDELETVEAGLKNSFDVLKPGGRLLVISFHSLEDRLVKKFFRSVSDASRGEIINKKPIVASHAEKKENPSSRSAKLRVIEKI